MDVVDIDVRVSSHLKEELRCAVCFKIITQAMDPKNKNRFDLYLFSTKISSIFMSHYKNRPDFYQNTKIDPIFITQN